MFLIPALFSLPMLIASVVGVVLIRARAASLPARTARFATIGLAMLAASTVVSMVWQAALPVVFRADRPLYTVAAGAEWLLTAGLSVAGLGLLVAAVLSRGRPAAAEPWGAPRPPFIQ